MAVAKSYMSLAIEEGPYMVNGKQYCKVRMKNGSLKQVRWYSDAEFAKMYPEEKVEVAASPDRKTQKDVLGFTHGYITIFKGDTYGNLEWFKRSIARYCKFWGWYIVSTDEIPTDLPITVTPIRLNWELVGKENGELIPEGQIAKAVEPLLYDASPSEYQGTIGERLELELTVVKTIVLTGAFGTSTMHIMEDSNKNVFVWTTAAKNWAEGSIKHIRGTVKEHRMYKNCKQTLLTRCTEI